MKKRRDLYILISLIGILAAVLSYQFVYTKYEAKTSAVEVEIASLQARINELDILQARMATYTEEIEQMNQEMDQYFLEFPAEVKTEDSIMFAVDMESNADNMRVSSVSIGGHEEIIRLGANASTTATDKATATTTDTVDTGTNDEVAVDTTVAGTTDSTTVTDTAATVAAGPVLYRIPVGMSFQVTYTGLKDMIRYIYKEQERMTIDSLAVSFDSTTGILSGTTNLNMYLMTGTNNVYKEPAIPDITLGTDNIFGTVVLPQTTE